MTKKDYVSYAVSDLMAKNGFDEYCDAYYHLHNNKELSEEEYFEIAPDKDFKNSNNKFRIGAPTLYEAQKWLREKYKIEVSAAYCRNRISYYYWYGRISCDDMEVRFGYNFSSYEEALNKGIFEALMYLFMTKQNTDKIDKAATDSCVIDNGIINPQIVPFYEQGFRDGARWSINSVWHEGSEKPETDKGDLLVEIEVMDKTTYVQQNVYYVLKYGCIRWAYIKDLISNKEE